MQKYLMYTSAPGHIVDSSGFALGIYIGTLASYLHMN